MIKAQVMFLVFFAVVEIAQHFLFVFDKRKSETEGFCNVFRIRSQDLIAQKQKSTSFRLSDSVEILLYRVHCNLIKRLVEVLKFNKFVIHSSFCNQVVVGSLFHNITFFHHHNPVCFLNGRKTVGNH